jgi:ribosome-associated protein
MNLPIDITSEITFKTARSGGKGGQNVNKVETMVEASFHIDASSLLTPEQKSLIHLKLANKINAEGMLRMRSQEHRTQLSNKMEVTRKMNEAVRLALHKDKKRFATKPSAASKKRRIESKKQVSLHKVNRQKIRYNDL